MPTVEARVQTERPSRYRVPLCKHFHNKGRHLGHRPRAHNGDGDAAALREMRVVAVQAKVKWSETEGTAVLPGTVCAAGPPGRRLSRRSVYWPLPYTSGWARSCSPAGGGPAGWRASSWRLSW
ncbi:hypothetical protein ACWCQW_25565 [Streptomyces mirabilis]